MRAAERSDPSAQPEPTWLPDLIDAAAGCGEDVDAAVTVAVEFGRRLPQPGCGDTLLRWRALAAVARVNVTTARVLEAHADALAILAEAGHIAAAVGSWGVFAAEAPGHRLRAEGYGDRLLLSGVKPWCSLGDRLDHALVTAEFGDQRQLLSTDLRHPTVRPGEAGGWVARGLRTVISVPVHFDATPAHPVGDAGWYLIRPGFGWGGIGVAACWFGAAAGVAQRVRAAADRHPGELAFMHAGAVDIALHGARAALVGAAARVDNGAATAAAGELLALQVRGVVADAVQSVLQHAAHALGPAPLAFDPWYAAQVADLELYVRQHHAERDQAALGELAAQRVAGERGDLVP